MKKIFVFLLPGLLFIACKKDNCPPPPDPGPQMRYVDLKDATVSFGTHKAIDLDSNGTIDISFSTLLVGDPLLQRDRQQYYVNTSFDVSLLVDGEEQTPALNKGDSIKLQARAGHNWYNGNSILLAEKIIELQDPAHWEGNWKSSQHKYIAIQIAKNNTRYNGWVEISFNTTTAQTILHRAGIAIQEHKTVLAGY